MKVNISILMVRYSYLTLNCLVLFLYLSRVLPALSFEMNSSADAIFFLLRGNQEFPPVENHLSRQRSYITPEVFQRMELRAAHLRAAYTEK